jgi:hypothetical protein
VFSISRYRILRVVSLLALLLPVAACGTADQEGGEAAMPVTGTAAVPAPETTRRLLFIHHSCGGQLMAEPGERVGGDRGSGERCIYESHPNGGGLRALLEAANYEVHELSYESVLGADTDIRHWYRKFAGHMDDLLATDHQDRKYADGRKNDIIAFKSCYPNNDFTGPGVEPGDPEGEEKTVANAKAAYRALLPYFSIRPQVLFVAFTAPPRAEPKKGLKDRLKGALGSGPSAADYAREFNTWLADRENGWLAGYEPSNVVVFDYYDILTDGRGNWSAYPTGGGRDSHPSREGNAKAAAAFVPFLNAAVAGMR